MFDFWHSLNGILSQFFFLTWQVIFLIKFNSLRFRQLKQHVILIICIFIIYYSTNNNAILKKTNETIYPEFIIIWAPSAMAI